LQPEANTPQTPRPFDEPVSPPFVPHLNDENEDEYGIIGGDYIEMDLEGGFEFGIDNIRINEALNGIDF